MNTTPLLSGYWCGGYRNTGSPTPLDQLVTKINVVPLAFAGLKSDSTMGTDFLCRNYTAKQIQTMAHTLQRQGQKVTMSIIDSSSVHWTDVDLDKYAKSAKSTALDEWGLDGFDIDVEGEYIDALKTFIPKLRDTIGTGPVISFTCYTGSEEELSILTAVKDSINWMQTMAYWLNVDQMKQLAETYAKIVGKENVAIGVKVGVTSTSECTILADWVKEEGYRGMMLWSADKDNSSYTNQKEWTWTNSIAKGFEEGVSTFDWIAASASGIWSRLFSSARQIQGGHLHEILPRQVPPPQQNPSELETQKAAAEKELAKLQGSGCPLP